MCGIVGYAGLREPKGILLEGLEKLEYRGYDSAGIAICSRDNEIIREKEVGRLENLRRLCEKREFDGRIGIGHTRWATHGVPSKKNSHPHLSGDKIALVHNGIIENYSELREELKEKGYEFLSETDSETVVHLLDYYYKGDMLEALQKVVDRLDGTYALSIINRENKEDIYFARKGSPLVIGLGEGENFLASDMTAILKYTNKIVFVEDDNIGRLTKDSLNIYDIGGSEVEVEVEEIEFSIEASEKGGYEDFMLKEIFEQDRVIEDTLRGKIKDDKVIIDEFKISDEEVKKLGKIHIVACGTSYYAGLIGKNIIEKWIRLGVEVHFASEFRYGDPIVGKDDLVLLISQSGETADTLAGLREAKGKGAKAFGIINVLGSTISREADGTLYTNAGPEIGVASTKAFTSQLIALYLFTLFLGEKRNMLGSNERKEIIDSLKGLSSKVKEVFLLEDEIREKAKLFDGVSSTMYIGRNINYPIALEGALKLKEISYIHAEAYPSGELKHGPIALIEDACPTVAIGTDSSTYEKVKSNIEEIRARSGRVLGFGTIGNTDLKDICTEVIYLPRVEEVFSPVVNVVALQLLSYYVAKNRGLDVDKPRNLAKSVTVE